MSTTISEKELPIEIGAEQAVEAAYATELAEICSKLLSGLPCLVECDKDVAPFLFLNVRNRLRSSSIRCLYLDGRQGPEEQGGLPQGLIGTMISQLRNAVRGAVERRIVVLPHLDLLTTSQGGLTAEAREVIPLLYENPELVWLGFKDPSFSVPKVIENLFLHHVSILGVPRTKLKDLITQKESRKFGKTFNPWTLYKHVSGVNAVRLRKLLSTLQGEDYPENTKKVYQHLRQATVVGSLEIPNISLDKDIGGYTKVKKRLREEILNTLSSKDNLSDPAELSRIEELIPKGMIFWGPPGTGKTLFAKGIASSIGAAITVVSGPELKSKWVGESEEALRRIFYQARQSAPSIIVFDELDSFAVARGTYTGSGVEHSMVNQLLTEMDGFHKEEMVFVIGTTNFVESLDPALLRPGRFEFHLHIPYPDENDRREILKIYDKKMKLNFSKDGLDYAVRRTGDEYVTSTGTPFSGDHINALCRAVARIKLRENITRSLDQKDVERGLTEYEEKLEVSDKDAVLVATHEAGHFICSLGCPNHPPPERITIQSEMPWAPFFTGFQKEAIKRIGYSKTELLDKMIVLYGGIEAERLLLKDVSSGASGFGHPNSDLTRATEIAKMIVEVCGMGGKNTGLRVFRDNKGERDLISGSIAEKIDREIDFYIKDAQEKAVNILEKNIDLLTKVRDELIKDKNIQGDRVKDLAKEFVSI